MRKKLTAWVGFELGIVFLRVFQAVDIGVSTRVYDDVKFKQRHSVCLIVKCGHDETDEEMHSLIVSVFSSASRWGWFIRL